MLDGLNMSYISSFQLLGDRGMIVRNLQMREKRIGGVVVMAGAPCGHSAGLEVHSISVFAWDLSLFCPCTLMPFSTPSPQIVRPKPWLSITVSHFSWAGVLAPNPPEGLWSCFLVTALPAADYPHIPPLPPPFAMRSLFGRSSDIH